MQVRVGDKARLLRNGVQHPLAEIVVGVANDNHSMLGVGGIDRADVISGIACKNQQIVGMLLATKVQGARLEARR